jgi:hypothetical protein
MIRSWVLVVVALALLAQACAKEPVRAELERLQKQKGLNLVSVYDSEINTVDFAHRSKVKVLPFPGRGGATHGAISPQGNSV